MNLTTGQRRALDILRNSPAAVVRPGTVSGPKDISFVTAQWLVVGGLARPTHEPAPMGSVVITAAGRAASRRELARAVLEVPLYLHARDGLTSERAHAIPGEPEVIDPATVAPWWVEQALCRRAEAADRRARARAHRDIRRAA